MNQTTADGFFCVFNGKKFLPGEAEVCHLLFLHSVEYTDSAEIAGTPPDGEAASLKQRDEKINDLEEQIRDLSIYIEAQKTLSDIADADGIRGGTILPMPSNQASSANTRKHKSGRRRN